MKKSLWIFAVVIFTGALVFPLTLKAVDSEKEEIEVKETVLFGDAGEAEGIWMEMGTHWDSRLLWETRYQPGKTEEAKSRFTFFPDQVLWKKESAAVVNLERSMNYGTAQVINGNNGAKEEQKYDILSEPVAPLLQAAAERTAPGETHTETLTVKDYLEYYPAYIKVFHEERDVYLAGAWTDRLEEIFDLRVSEDARAQVTVSKNDREAVTGFEVRISDYGIIGTFDFGEEGCFYSFYREYREDGEALKDGTPCCIYYLPYLENPYKKRGYTIDVDGIRSVCSLPEGVIPVELVLDEEGDCLYLAAKDGSRYELFVYEIRGQELVERQRLSVPETEDMDREDEGFPRYRQMRVQEDGILLTWEGNHFVFLAEREGEYRVWCVGSFPVAVKDEKAKDEDTYDRLAEVSVFADENAFAFDGERLALAAVDRWRDMSTRLQVFRDGELVYSGFYEYSGELDKVFGTWEGDCIQVWGEASWGARQHSSVTQKPLRLYFSQ